MGHAISLTDVSFSWPNQKRFVMNIANWQVARGQKVFLYGRSGEGKSTLLSLLSRIENRYSGNISILG